MPKQSATCRMQDILHCGWPDFSVKLCEHTYTHIHTQVGCVHSPLYNTRDNLGIISNTVWQCVKFVWFV